MAVRLLRWVPFGALMVAVAFGLLLVALDWAATARETEAQDTSAPSGGRLLQALPLDPTFGRMFVQEWGPRDATPVLISHGAGAWSGFWADTAQGLAAAGYRVVAVDLPPFGFSDRDPEARYSRADQAARLIGVLDELDACRGVLIGHSSGSGPVLEALLRYPQRIQGAVLVSAALSLPPDGEEPTEPSGLVAAILDSPLASRVYTASTLSNPWLTERLLSSTLAHSGAATRERVDVLRRPLRRTGTTAAYAAALPYLLGPDLEALSRRSEGLRSIPRPVALIWGDADTVAPLAEGERLVKLIPDASLDVLPGIGHVPHIEAPDETLRLLQARLARVSPDATNRNAPRLLDREACQLGGLR